jgi:hypothetical protein
MAQKTDTIDCLSRNVVAGHSQGPWGSLGSNLLERGAPIKLADMIHPVCLHYLELRKPVHHF